MFMEAGRIKDIIGKLDKLPYRCIMFDGVWGIGKTYAVDEVLDEQKNCCKISMFGLQNSQQIYHEIICRLTRWKHLPDIAKKADKISNHLSKISDKANTTKELLYGFIDEKELFVTFSRGFKTWHYIVIDDLERMSSDINLEEIMGVVEELKKCSYVKVIILVNKNMMSDDAKNILQKYEEKVIDRTYHITEIPSKINWGNLGIHAFFMQDFRKKHNVKNLRTLQKAQDFYDDVKLHMKAIENEEFDKDVRLICFAIVTEPIENLYSNDGQKASAENIKEPSEKVIMKQINNHLDHRIKNNYLPGIRSGAGLVNLLLKYYHNEIDWNDELIEAEYQVFLKVGTKPVSYMTEPEVKALLAQWEKNLDAIVTIGELNSTASTYVYYSKILEEDYSLFLKRYEKKLYTIMTETVSSGHDMILSYDADVLDSLSGEMKEIYNKVRAIVREEWIVSYLDDLCDLAMPDRKAFEYSYTLRKCYEDNEDKKILQKHLDKLYNVKFFPVTNMSDDKRDTCYNVMSILYRADRDRFLKYCDGIECDRMAQYRMDKLVEEIKRNY